MFQSGEIFYLEDSSVVQDVPQVVNIIQGIITQVNFPVHYTKTLDISS